MARKSSLFILFMLISLLSQSFTLAQPTSETNKNEVEIKIGLVGLDTSHVITFAQLLNDPNNPKRVTGARIVAGYPGGSPDFEPSYSRVEGFTNRLKNEFGVEIVNSIESLCERVDAIMLTSVDGRVHLEQAKIIFQAKKPVFIDKPLASSLRDAIKIANLAKEHGVPWFTSSSYRFYPSLTKLKQQDVGKIHTVISYGPCHYAPPHPDLFWYGIHPTEALFAVMGTGCETVSRIATKDTDVVTGVWKDGRVGVLIGLRKGNLPHQVIVFGEKGTAKQEENDDFLPLAIEIVNFFKTKVPPIPQEETLEIFAFLESAEESKRQDGIPIKIQEIIEKTQKTIEDK